MTDIYLHVLCAHDRLLTLVLLQHPTVDLDPVGQDLRILADDVEHARQHVDQEENGEDGEPDGDVDLQVHIPTVLNHA